MRKMHPILASEQIVADYKRYLRSLLPISDVTLSSELDALIEKTNSLVQGPYLEATPAFTRGATIRDLMKEDVLPSNFEIFDSPALPLDRALYLHQEKAIRKARAGRNYVVSTGTGSGKTECFIIPILAALADELLQSSLQPGIRALLLYPMNALANDQMKRLRQILAVAPEITFGRYVGDTLTEKSAAEARFKSLNIGESRLPNELLSRQEMQERPPHFLLTNYAMLEYLLLRPRDMDLFEGQYAGNWRFLVVDEAHVYDGANGSELAMLLRRLQERVVTSKSFQAIATSATMGAERDPQAVAQFATNLFGTTFEAIEGDASRTDIIIGSRISIHSGSWGPLTPQEYAELEAGGNLEEKLRALSLKYNVPWSNPYKFLAQERAMSQIRIALAENPKVLGQVVATMLPGWLVEDIANIVDVGSRVFDDTGVPILSARYHLWLRASEGAFTCLNLREPHLYLARQERCDKCERPTFEFGCCKKCGTTYILGTEEHEGGRVRLRSRLKLSEPPTWIALTAEKIIEDEDEELWEEDVPESRDAVEICIDCGGILPEASTSCSHCNLSNLRSGRVAKSRATQISGCIVCGSRSKGEVRLLDSGADASASVLATSLYQNLSPDQGEARKFPGEGRKLLVFSDSRQGAAYFAPYLEGTYARLIQRRMLFEAMSVAMEKEDGPARLDDVITDAFQLAVRAGYFEDSLTNRNRRQQVGLWLAQELVAIDFRQSLEGLGMILFKLRIPPNFVLPKIFQDLGFSFDEVIALIEELLGYVRRSGSVSMPEDVNQADEAFLPRLGPIYIRELKSDFRMMSWSPTRGSNRRSDYLARVLQEKGFEGDTKAVLDGLWRFITESTKWLINKPHDHRIGDGWQVDYKELLVNVNSTTDPSYKCTICGQQSYRSVMGICPTMRCQGRLEHFNLESIGLDRSHYRRLYRSLNPIPLAVKEHTAQWKAIEAAEIQNDFITGKINVLSCSTTFELGVDVGELQAVLLANIPPATARYVQRAGRAGRRTESAALVVAFARRRSHDLSRFASPVETIAGRVRAPIIPLKNVRIDRRHAHSIALSAFFRASFLQDGREWRKVGEFFALDRSGVTPLDQFKDFLSPPSPSLKASLIKVLPEEVLLELDLDAGLWVEELLGLLAKVQSEVQEEITYFREASKRAFDADKYVLVAQLGRVLKTLEQRDLLGFLGSRNVLPKYGFPVDVVDLRTANSASPIGAKLDLSRDLSSAIYEYAPGSQVVAGGLLWESAGVYRLPDKDLVSGTYAECDNCHHFEYTLDRLDVTCSECQNQRKTHNFVIPEFGFIAEKNPMRTSGVQPSRSWNGSTQYLGSGKPRHFDFHRNSNSLLRWSTEAAERAVLVAISSGPGGAGFWLCEWCGRGIPGNQSIPASHSHTWKDSACKGPLKRSSLIHKYETDILVIEVLNYPNLSNDYYWSLLYAILESAADLLQISRDDIDGTLAFGPQSKKLVLFDTVPGGAGCVLQVGPRLNEVLDTALKRMKECECGEETSCYSCLRGYRNQMRHENLVRGHAIHMLEGMI